MINIIALTNPRSASAEAYRTLRTNIEFTGVDEPIHTLLVTSATPNEGKSAALANLAVVMAEGGRKVILVDADLRRPAQHTLFDLPNERGFTTMFTDDHDLENPQLHSVPDTTLSVLTSGQLPPIPSQLLASKRIRQVIDRLAELADFVIFNSPPVVTVNDASLLASQVDGVLLVVKANSTKRDHVKAAQDRLTKVNARLVGAVLTNTPVDNQLQYE